MSSVIDRAGCHPVQAAVDGLRAGLTGLVEEPVWTLSDGQLAPAVTAAVALVTQSQAMLLRLVGEADARGVAAVMGAPSTTSWLRARHHLHPGQASQLVKTAHAFRVGLPATQAALGAGQISLAHAHQIVRAHGDLPDGVDPALAASAEARMVRDAKSFDPVTAGRLARYVVSRIDPAGADTREG